MKTKERQADIQRSILVSLSGLINEKTCIPYGFVVGICTDTGTDSFYFKQVIGEIPDVVLCIFFINKTQFIPNRGFLEQAY